MKDSKTRPRSDCNSDHQFLNVGIKLRLKKMEQPHHPSRLDFKTLNGDFRIDVNNRFEVLLGCDLESRSSNNLWEVGKEIMVSTAKERINKTKKKKKEWISDETIKEVEIRRYLNENGINTPVESSVYRMQNSKIQKIMREDKENFIVEQCKIVEANRITNSTKGLYQGARNSTRKLKPSNDAVKEEDGTILCDGEDIKKRWKECCSKLYAKRNNVNTVFYASQQTSIEPEPLLNEVGKATQSLKLGKSSGLDDITELIRKNYGTA